MQANKTAPQNILSTLLHKPAYLRLPLSHSIREAREPLYCAGVIPFWGVPSADHADWACNKLLPLSATAASGSLPAKKHSIGWPFFLHYQGTKPDTDGTAADIGHARFRHLHTVIHTTLTK